MEKDLRKDRIEKLKKIKKAGINPYPSLTLEKQDIDKVLKKKPKTNVLVVGRIMLFRDMGKITFIQIKDETGRIQLVLRKDDLSDKYKFWLKNLDLGDFVSVKGQRFDTQKGEKSVLVKELTLLTKSIRPLPHKYKKLKDEDEKLRKRYLDILYNKDVQEMIYKKDKFWNSVRDFLRKRGFIEVETPVLENVAGGADANPFSTFHKALSMDVYLRISMGELWQKRLMVAGLEKTFEIGRQFRNEGMDAEHLQDYTQMEFYWAYSDYKRGMNFVKELYRYVAMETFGTLKFKIKNFNVDLSKEWENYDYRETVKKYTRIDVLNTDLEEIKKKLKELNINYDKKGFNVARGVDNLWKYCRKKIAGPGFLINLPLIVSPLAKKMENNPKLVERFQPIIAGSELGNGYSELNDPFDQAGRFSEQQGLRDAGDEEAQMHDKDFVEALEYGMPPTCGFGMSERVFSFLSNKTLRECQIFPLMKPKEIARIRREKKDNEDSQKELGIDYKKAKELVEIHIKDETTKLHSYESEAIMKELAKKIGEDEEIWGMVGLLHDLDWEKTKDNPKNHTIEAKKILKKVGASDFLINTVMSHNYGCATNDDLKNKSRSTKIEYGLAASETLTGLIVASVLVLPSRKIEDLKVKSLKKKYKSKSFASNCRREIIKEVEKLGLSLDEFFEIGIKALQKIAKDIGL